MPANRHDSYTRVDEPISHERPFGVWPVYRPVPDWTDGLRGSGQTSLQLQTLRLKVVTLVFFNIRICIREQLKVNGLPW